MPKNDSPKHLNLFDWVYKRNKERDALADTDTERSFTYFFKLLFRNMDRLFIVNLLAVFGNLPVFLILYVMTGNLFINVTVPQSALFGPIYGAVTAGAVNPATTALLAVNGAVADYSVWTTTATVFIAVGAALLLITFGPISVGTTYILRNIVKGEPIFMWSDFKYAIKKNLRQSWLLGILDLVILTLFGYNIYFYYLNIGSAFIYSVLFLASILMLLFYVFMRYYLYVLLVTFDLSIPKILKNALIFSMIGFKRNILALIGCLFVVFLNYLILLALIPLGIALPLIITVGLCSFIAVYASWPKVKKIMIDPYT